MRRTAGFLACTLILLLLPVRALHAQRAVVRGHIADSAGTALPHAQLSLGGIRLTVSSNDQGDYQIRGVAPGTHTLRVRLLGYTPQSARITVTAGGTVQQDFIMVSQPIGLSAIDVVVGSRAPHVAAEELAVPVDVYVAEDLARQGTSETSQILATLTPSMNFPRQSVTDATDIVRPFTLRGLSPDHTLVLVNGWRRHQTAVVNTFAYGTNAGSSGVDLNAIPASALERVEVLRDGASAQYGSDAIAGVVNLVIKEGAFAPFVNVEAGRYAVPGYPDDGRMIDVNGGWGFGLGRGSLSLFAEVLDRQPTNRAWADPYEDAGTGLTDSVNSEGRVVDKNNPVPQPNHHWGDGLERDIMTMANLRMPLNDTRTSEIYAFGGYSSRSGTGNGYRRCAVDCGSFIGGRNWLEIYPLGYLPEFNPDATDYSAAGGFRAVAAGWSLDAGASFGHNDFDYKLRNTLNVSLGPCLAPAAPCAPGPDSIMGTGDEIANQTSFFAGRVLREEMGVGLTAARSLNLGLPAPVSLAVGAAFRLERFRITQGDRASWIDGNHLAADSTDGRPYSQVFPGFRPADEADEDRTNVGVFAELETNPTERLLVNVAGRYENYSDFGSRLTGKAALRYQPSRQLTLRAAGSTGFRAPGIGQSHFSHVSTNVIAGVVTDVLISPVGDSAARLLGSKPLQEETSFNLSAGLAYSPLQNFTVTADYFRITINDRILLGATFDDNVTLALLAASGFSNVGGVQYFTNGLDTRTQGVDVTANLRLPAAAGMLDLTGAVNYTSNKITRVDPLPAVLSNAGSTEPGIIDSVTYIGITEERPDWRGTLTAQYSMGRVRALARGSYYGKFSSAQPGYCDNCRDRYGAKTLFDAEVGYRISQVDLSIGIRNLFNTYPDQPTAQTLVDPTDPSLGTAKDYNSNSGIFPWAAASPFGYNGRYVYMRASIPLSR